MTALVLNKTCDTKANEKLMLSRKEVGFINKLHINVCKTKKWRTSFESLGCAIMSYIF